MKKGLLIILSGPSGVGKGAVRRILMENNKLNLAYSISMTTRAPRKLEENGKDYFFVSEEEFNENIKKGNFLEHASFVGNQYGTPKDKVEELRNQGKNVLLEIEVQGAQDVMEKCAGCHSVFIEPPSLQELERRLRGRGTETEEAIQLRLKTAEGELKAAQFYDKTIVNDNLKLAFCELKEYINSLAN